MTIPPASRSARRLTLRDVHLEAGRLPEATMAYETFGTLAPDRSNAVLIAHALTGDSHVTSSAADERTGWWEELVGPGRPIDTDEMFVICSNAVGGCTGSTGPASPALDGQPYGSRFPAVSIRDLARLDLALLDHLGIARVHAAVGGSMGGARVLELALEAPERVGRLGVVAAPAFSAADQIAWAHAQLGAIANDPAYHGGDYLAHGREPHRGLALARQIAHLTYRSPTELDQRFGRGTVDTARGCRPPDARQSTAPYFQAESYLDHHGRKLVDRFDAQSYVVLTDALSQHDVRRGRAPDLRGAVARYTGPALVVSIDSDRLYPPAQVRELAEALPGPVRCVELPSVGGHDGFLTEHRAIGAELASFLRPGWETRWATPLLRTRRQTIGTA